HRVTRDARIALHCDVFWKTSRAGRAPRFVAPEPLVPCRVEMIGALCAHPGSETLVQPEVIPPRHGHEILEPLVGHLMGDDCENRLSGGGSGILWIEKKSRFVIGNSAPVLHCAAKPARECDQVELWQWISDAEIIVEVVQNFGGAL